MLLTSHPARTRALVLVAALALVPGAAAAQRATGPRRAPLPDVRYLLRVSATDTNAIDVEMRVRGARDTFRLAWARHPEYDDRFWRYVEDMRIDEAANGASVEREPCAQPAGCDSARWRVVAPRGTATLRWRLRVPREPRPRAAWRPFLTPTGALVGGPHSFPYLVGAESAPPLVTLDLPDEWHVATALRPAGPPHTWLAADAAELVESPILVGRLREWRFDVRGVPHHVAYWPRPGAPAFDTATFVGDLERVAVQADSLFGGMPYREYRFLFNDDAYGGLEHPASVTLGAPSDELARDPRALLDETAHEFVHTWNLMAIRPAEYGGVTWEPVEPVPTLWFFEGLTMYYADALPRRAGIPARDTRAAHLEGLLARYLGNPAYARFSPESISRVAYNAGPEALGDYSASAHQVGEVVGTALDLMIRDATGGRRSMDDVMRALYRRSRQRAPGIGTADVERAAASVCACIARTFFDAHVRGATPVDMARWLRAAGYEMDVAWETQRNADGTASPDWRVWAWNPSPGAPLRLRMQTPSGVWGRAGLHTGDLVTAINGTRVTTWPEVRRVVSTLQVGDSVRVDLAASGDSAARTVRFAMTSIERPVVHLRPIADATPAQRAIGDAWLAGR